MLPRKFALDEINPNGSNLREFSKNKSPISLFNKFTLPVLNSAYRFKNLRFWRSIKIQPLSKMLYPAFTKASSKVLDNRGSLNNKP